jgi:hypothetical protein
MTVLASLIFFSTAAEMLDWAIVMVLLWLKSPSW